MTCQILHFFETKAKVKHKRSTQLIDAKPGENRYNMATSGRLDYSQSMNLHDHPTSPPDEQMTTTSAHGSQHRKITTIENTSTDTSHVTTRKEGNNPSSSHRLLPMAPLFLLLLNSDLWGSSYFDEIVLLSKGKVVVRVHQIHADLST